MKAAFIYFIFPAALFALLRFDARRRNGVSAAAWLVFLWVIVIGCRPVSTWVGYTAPDGTNPYVEGNPIERNVFLLLIFAGCAILGRRKIDIPAFLRANFWLVLFYAFWCFSILWADDPFVALKRLVKDFGNVVMALVILSEIKPLEAIRAVFVRSSYVLVLVSALFIRYLPDLGRTFSGYNSSDQMYIGVCSHKNTLGCLLIVSCIFVIWDIRACIADSDFVDRRARRLIVASHLGLLAISLWLLSLINSMTAVVCSVFALILIAVGQTQLIRRTYPALGAYLAFGGLFSWAMESLFDVKKTLLVWLGRDATLTGRTNAWELVVDFQDNQLLGAGFKSFWSGERMERIWQSFQGVVQAHNGYVETYLNGGIVGVALLAAWLLSTFQKMKFSLLSETDYGVIRITLLLVTLLYNYSEATFNQTTVLWFALVVVALQRPAESPATLTITDSSELLREREFLAGSVQR